MDIERETAVFKVKLPIKFDLYNLVCMAQNISKDEFFYEFMIKFLLLVRK